MNVDLLVRICAAGSDKDLVVFVRTEAVAQVPKVGLPCSDI